IPGTRHEMTLSPPDGGVPTRSTSSIKSAVNTVYAVNKVNTVQNPTRPPQADVALALLSVTNSYECYGNRPMDLARLRRVQGLF
ncbi:MAG: hypothetical protein ACKOAH_03995, partial [Pirellula sp.]